ncbi:MAG: UvrD-helicase domain-containing protein, partial [Bacilli bacterium]|nr:UvrD-helicase domain-containing protein [Bacilli bacterium]
MRLLPTWTKEQSDAIYKSGKNIIVSAGAGSGKTAVLTTRVLQKIENGIHVNELLILTFTKAAASEMKERIRKKLKKNTNLKSELSLLDTAYVTTFDSFSLSIVKKYHYLLNVSSNLKITDETMIEILRKDVLRKVLDQFYLEEDVKFLRLINEFCVKDDHEIYDSLLSISKILEKDFTKLERLDHFQKFYFNTLKIEECLNEFEQLILKKQVDLKEKVRELERIAPKSYISKIYDNLNSLLSVSRLDDFVSVKSSKLPPLPKNSEEELKETKEELNNTLKELKSLLDYGSKEQLKKDLFQLEEYVEVFVSILKAYFQEFERQKQEKNYYDFNDIAFLALNLLKHNEDVCEEIKNSFKEI